MIQSIDYWAIAAPLILALAAGLVLLLDAFLPARPGVRAALGCVTLAALVAAFVVVVAQRGVRETFCVPSIGCSYVVDATTIVFAGLALGAGAVVVLLSMAQLAEGDIPVGEWYFLLLAALAGAVTLPASRDLIMLVVALELVSLPVVALTALRRYDGRGAEAALKLFVVSVVSTAVMLFGVSLLYGVTGAVHLDAIAAALAQPERPGAGPVVAVGAVMVVAGFGFKIAAVPFHFWAADVYQGAPIPVAALLSVVSKAAGFAGLILLLTQALPSESATWTPIVAVLAALTMTVGNVLALRQIHPVRLLAWSSVAQSGYILAPVATTDAQAATAYLVFYAAMNLTAFAVVMAVPHDTLDGYRGLVSARPVAGLALAFALICLAGLPPGLAGLFAKVVVFREVVAGGLGWLAVVMAVNTVIGLYYYIAWTARLFTPADATRPAASGPAWIAVGVATAVAVGFSAAPQFVLATLG
ncbi:NADH-quinone oxidoreductase subunit N [Herbidospora yilanensis]|uniref:NADH-quinone oxidoreductase subunit N n=1 Tax=Herbidospora yilanensis TaxID=354426 RepID=UPI0007862440|nr:NADH-quinone oxidoreductase subunit N [Herbidospora yilanensis]